MSEKFTEMSCPVFQSIRGCLSAADKALGILNYLTQWVEILLMQNCMADPVFTFRARPWSAAGKGAALRGTSLASEIVGGAPAQKRQPTTAKGPQIREPSWHDRGLTLADWLALTVLVIPSWMRV